MNGPRLAAAGLVLALLACGSPPRPRDHRVVGIENAPASLDPRTGFDQASARVQDLLFDGLIGLDDTLSPSPLLAESWEWESSTRLRLKLREGVRFHDGRPLEAEDVAHTIRSMQDPATASPRRADLEVIAAMETPSPHEVVLALAKPWAPLLANLNFGIVPRDAGPDFADHPVGAGPFRLLEVAPGQWVRLEAFADYWDGAPPVRRLDLKVVPDGTVRALELRKGAVDVLINDLSPDVAAALARDPDYQVTHTPGMNVTYLAFQLEDPALSDVRVRRALALATDRRALLAHLQRGLGAPAASLLPPFHWSCAPPVDVPFDPGRAAQLLDEAGARAGAGGVRLRLTMKTSTTPMALLIGQALQEQWWRVGVRLSLDSREWGPFFADVKRGDFQVTTLTWVGITDPDAYRLRFSSRHIPPEDPGGMNRCRYRNPEVDAWLEAGAVAAAPEERRAHYENVQRALERDLPYVFLWFKDNVVAGRQGIAMPRPAPDGSFRCLANWDPVTRVE